MDFRNHLKKYLPEQELDALMTSFDDEPKHAVLLNPKKMSTRNFLLRYPHVTPHPLVKNGFLYDKKEYDLGKSVEHELGAFYLQEPSAMVAASLMDFSESDIVLDLCAAPGGKSVQTSYLMNNRGLIISNDISRSRAGKILENVERLGLGNIMITSNDFSLIYRNYIDTFDKIVLDAPCSGSGMFRKNDLVKLDWTYEKVLKCQEIQKQLILIVYQMLKPGGLLSYSTCSFSYEEDEEVIKYLLANTDAELSPIKKCELFYTTENTIGVHLFPHHFPGEGHYICHIKKPLRPFVRMREPDIKLSNRTIEGFQFVVNYGSTLFGLSKLFPTKGLSIIRNGVKIGEVSGNVIKYDIHYARFMNSFSPTLEIDESDCLEYLKGNYLKREHQSGFVMLKYQGINIDIAKSDGKIIKNRYPKYLKRKNIA